MCADLTLLLRARIEGWFKRPLIMEKKIKKEALKKILASHHHRRNLVFFVAADSHFISSNIRPISDFITHHT